MTRVLSALALLPIVVGTIWLLPPIATFVLAAMVLLLAVIEYSDLAAASGVVVSRIFTAALTLATCTAVGLAPVSFPVVVMAGGMFIAATQFSFEREERALSAVTATAFALIYLGVPIGALVALRIHGGREVVLLLLATIMVSDTAQYYGGRLLGRRPLAPATSPNKTVEGALFGVVAGMFVVLIVGRLWFPALSPLSHLVLGATVAGLGIIGDLFESQLKRGSGVKDTSRLIPGHGGVLDRIDGLIFAVPVYYTVVWFVG